MDGRHSGDAKERTLRPARALGALCLAWVGLVACHDSPSDPLAAITTVETVPSLAISAQLPALADLAARFPDDPRLTGAVDAWEASWDREDGELTRSQVRQQVAPALDDLLGPSAAQTVIRSLHWLRDTPDLPGRLPPGLSEPVSRSLDLLARAEDARDDGRHQAALEWALAASDVVRSVTPEAVARRLIAQGHSLMASGDWALGDRQRAQHLLSGARRALEREDYSRAIQRAFYACQVMEGTVDEGAEPGDRDAAAEPEIGHDATSVPETGYDVLEGGTAGR